MTKDLNNKLPIPEDVKKLKKIFEERVGLGVRVLIWEYAALKF